MTPSPSPVVFLLEIAGAAALLLWSVRLVRTGVERGWSVGLRRLLRRGSDNRLLAALSGAGAALVLQSSTAVALLSVDFVTTGALGAGAALAVLLGADLGSALVAQLLLARPDWLAPLILLAGVVLFTKSPAVKGRMLGRVLIGLGLIFVSLSMISNATELLRHAPGLAPVLGYLGRDLATAFLIGAAFAWGVHSSVAAVLMFVMLANAGVLPEAAGTAMILGANLGGACIAFMLSLAAPADARRVIIANVLLRGGGALLMLAVMVTADLSALLIGSDTAQRLISLHVLFNLLILLLMLPFTNAIVATLARLIPTRDTSEPLLRISALDSSALADPERALSCASREILQMGEIVESMLRQIPPLLKKWDPAAAGALQRMETETDAMFLQVKLYLAQLQRRDLNANHARRAMELAETAVNLENAGNAIGRTMVRLAERRDGAQLRFSATGYTELQDFHDRVLANVQMALNVLMTQNPDAARALVAEKDRVRDVEASLQRSHLQRLRDGESDTLGSTNIHQEMLRALKQVNTCFAQIAYPILSESGGLLTSRLAKQRD